MSIEYPCVHWDKGKCKKFSDDKVTSWCVEGPCVEQMLSNADRIRAMSDEELAELLLDGCRGSNCDDQPQNEWGSVNCFQCRANWLKQQAEEQRWIPVTERLPEDVYGKDREQIVVLVCTKSGKVSQCARMADYECIADASLTKVEWIKNGKFYWSKGKNVTHWMPLPQPPKGDRQ